MIIIAFIILILSGIAKAVIDKVNFHYNHSIFKNLNAQFWNPKFSSNNKWKDGIKKRGPKFLWSSTLLVWTTDAWHLFQMIHGITFASGFYILGIEGNLWLLPVGYAVATGVFELFFKYIFEK